ncbi:MAG: ribbon-helix-helix domain-containing protein, partial [Bifidobacteriaceae bacterium]|nr:ribbon-helix-helix domain-containing protein [Bifidobacteriaceae bacterium]
MRRTNIYLDEQLVATLARQAGDRGVSQAALIRQTLRQALLDPDGGLEADLAAIRESGGAAPGFEAPAPRQPSLR